ncbi:phospholipase A2 inhibitor gamma subunit B-like [Mauremys mutica]|uniref:phospholipase A2 inhibitor gamma subunit B-like n=1 Tax=Mauremys mutica TaxID=74926 RepID=UPI001D15F72A|nr:phospholipase A2 inhibitor gamma subunit B-like [Mauremys mutica]
MEASIAACILAALLATGACLRCEVCFGLGTSCTGDLETCAAGEDSCGVALTESTLVPPADTTPNGRSCPGCVAVFADQCSEKTIQCTGDETRCVDIVETLTTGGNPVQMVMKGCASESVCAQIKLGSSTFAGLSADLTTAKCTVASGAVEVAPGPGGLQLLKLLS